MSEDIQDPINIEEIMQQIRREILESQALLGKDGQPLVSVEGETLPPEFYEHLYHAGMSYNQIGVKMLVTPVNIPLVGSIVEKLRIKVHQLVLFYVNQIADQQIEFNTHILQAVNTLAEHVEAQQEGNDA
jgi:hypothetical protein